LEDQGVDGSIILRWIFRKWDWIDLAQDRNSLAGTCECGNELSGSIKCGEFLLVSFSRRTLFSMELVAMEKQHCGIVV
jgi:hypothetical protein